MGSNYPRRNFKAGEGLSADAIHNHLSQHFAKWQLPGVIFTNAVKRTSVGNADKKQLRADYERLYLKVTKHN
jgi:acyl-CoA synthetase (AMP-forming)/AMP-acid ligase II